MAELMSSPLRSPLPEEELPLPALPPPPTPTPTPNHTTPTSPPPHPAAEAIVLRAARHDPPPPPQQLAADGGGWYAWTGGRGGEEEHPQSQSQSRVVSGIVRRGRRAAALRRAAVAARAAAALLCLLAFSVLAADRRKGWALDSYSNYSQFRYCVAVNVIGFLYAGFQVSSQVMQMKKGKPVIGRPAGHYFDFAMDQVLAYLLVSASSSATARVGDWVSNWGTDPFPSMANGSIAVSFLAFLAFALSSLISAYNLFCPDL
ncbi:CASP-like protein 4A1 [Ananas comosus]|uniref:CASP-like protein n=1 Tax=Ananas comosus TaxID=4615 RepID=A0A199VAY8_ANACO|nr:CASP-like protein 4A1 [Ananas comosus]